MADAALAIARMTAASDWGPLPVRAFPKRFMKDRALYELQRRFLTAIVDNDECWDGLVRPTMRFHTVGCRQTGTSSVTDSTGAATTG